jgi:hypothetical protein
VSVIDRWKRGKSVKKWKRWLFAPLALLGAAGAAIGIKRWRRPPGEGG